ncbi:hypothetical protein KIW84_044779 [Lathyrus oleraceus]|uniref:Uncharacterized protein n=1 Tax=Pisum sativum TaxID=3888 RepID=A0A9D4XIM2_PEA|nr:hypothetical protein KIW84_044779 [Pisum sativum]
MFLLKFICLGDHIPTSHHIDVILEGLTVEHAPVVSIDESKFGVMDIDEVEILILEPPVDDSQTASTDSSST